MFSFYMNQEGTQQFPHPNYQYQKISQEYLPSHSPQESIKAQVFLTSESRSSIEASQDLLLSEIVGEGVDSLATTRPEYLISGSTSDGVDCGTSSYAPVANALPKSKPRARPATTKKIAIVQ